MEHLSNSNYFEKEGNNYEITKDGVKVFLISIKNDLLVECLQILHLTVDISSDNIVENPHNNYNIICYYFNITDYFDNEGIDKKILARQVRAFIKLRTIEEKIKIAR